MIKTVKCFDELWISSDHNPLGFNKKLKSSASKFRNSHWKASYYGRVVKAMDLRSNGQVSSWVRTPVVTLVLKFAVEWVCPRKQTNESFEMIKTVKCFDELWIASDHNPLGFNKKLKSSASKFRNSHWKASYYGRVVKAMDLRSNGQVFSWVRTPVVAFFLETAVGSEVVTESKQITVSKWLRQRNVLMNYEFHQITILLASIKNWKAPRVNSETPIEKQATMAEWLRRWT